MAKCRSCGRAEGTGQHCDECATLTRAAHTSPRCENCNTLQAMTRERPHGVSECDACYRESLRYGHIHGMHTDGEAYATDHYAGRVEGCPLCHQIPDVDDPLNETAVSKLARLTVHDEADGDHSLTVVGYPSRHGVTLPVWIDYLVRHWLEGDSLRLSTPRTVTPDDETPNVYADDLVWEITPYRAKR